MVLVTSMKRHAGVEIVSMVTRDEGIIELTHRTFNVVKAEGMLNP